LIINCGIKRVVCEFKYHSGSESEGMFVEAGIELVYVNDEVLQYAKQQVDNIDNAEQGK